MDGKPTVPGARGVDRRALLAAAGGVALLHLAGCGKDDGPAPTPPAAKRPGPRKGKPHRPNRPISERPPGAKTTKRKHPAPQTSARHSKAPLPAELQGFIAARWKAGALVQGRRSPVVHHPVVCKGHLPRGTTGAASSATLGAPRIHQRYADGILYALARAETDPDVALGVALVAAVTWPVSTRFADLALARIAASGKPRDAETLATAFAAVGSPSPDARVEEGLRVLEARASATGR